MDRRVVASWLCQPVVCVASGCDTPADVLKDQSRYSNSEAKHSRVQMNNVTNTLTNRRLPAGESDVSTGYWKAYNVMWPTKTRHPLPYDSILSP